MIENFSTTKHNNDSIFLKIRFTNIPHLGGVSWPFHDSKRTRKDQNLHLHHSFFIQEFTNYLKNDTFRKFKQKLSDLFTLSQLQIIYS